MADNCSGVYVDIVMLKYGEVTATMLRQEGIEMLGRESRFFFFSNSHVIL